jgi:hypothetical protein
MTGIEATAKFLIWRCNCKQLFNTGIDNAIMTYIVQQDLVLVPLLLLAIAVGQML